MSRLMLQIHLHVAKARRIKQASFIVHDKRSFSTSVCCVESLASVPKS